MQRISLKELFTCQKLGSVQLGMLDKDIEAILGKPDTTGGFSRKFKKPNIWKYGDIEFGFNPKTRRLAHIVFNFFQLDGSPPSGGKNIDLEPMNIRSGMTLSELENLLKKEKLSYRELKPTTPGTREIIVNESINIIVNESKNIFGDFLGLVKIGIYQILTE